MSGGIVSLIAIGRLGVRFGLRNRLEILTLGETGKSGRALGRLELLPVAAKKPGHGYTALGSRKQRIWAPMVPDAGVNLTCNLPSALANLPDSNGPR